MKKQLLFILLSVSSLAFVQAQTVNVTFQVDMTGIEVVPTGVYIAGGSVAPDNNAGLALSDADGDDVWTLTTAVPANTQYLFKYRNGAAPSPGDWCCFEESAPLAAGGCGTGQYDDRFIDVGSVDLVLSVVKYGSCDAGDPTSTDHLGCLDSNATNYSATATEQELDQYGNLLCVYTSCDDVPENGCMYADSFGAFNEGFDAVACVSYGGTACDGGASGGSGCMDANASNYDATATTQAVDQYSNILCTYASCADVPEAGCMYAESFGVYAEGFGAAECSGYGGTPCDGGASGGSGCMDANATNYDATATTQAVDQYGNLLCVYTSCDDVPEAGCMYAESFGVYAEGFGAAECSGYGGTPCETVGLFETELNAANIYPNPSADFIRISNTDAENITVFNINGQQVLSVNDSDKEINVSHLSSGIYTLRVTDSKGGFTYSKLIKE